MEKQRGLKMMCARLPQAIRTSLLLVSFSTLVACGGGGSGSDSPSGSAQDGRIVTGNAVKGPFQGSTLRIYKHDIQGLIADPTPISQATTDSGGGFTTNPLPNAMTALLGVSGGGFHDESDPAGQRFISWPVNQELLGFLPAGKTTAAITPLSDHLVRKSRRDASTGLGFLHSISENRRLAGIAFGFDPIGIVPPNPTNPPAGASEDELQYAMYLGGIAQLVNSASLAMGFTAPDFDMVKAVLRDNEDCIQDGRLFGQVLEVNGQPLPTNLNLNDEINRFRNNNFDRLGNVPLVKVDAPLCANKLPRAQDDNQTLTEGSSVDIDVLSNDSDPDGTLVASSIEIITAPAKGQAQVVAGKVRFSAPVISVGADSFSYRVLDNLGARTNVATVNLNISDNNLAPVANPDAVAIVEDSGPVNINVLANDTDDGSLVPSSLAIVAAPTNGTATINANFEIVYTPNLNFFGNDQFTYQVADNEGVLSNVAAVDITVGAAGDPPVISDILDRSIAENSATGAIGFTVSDVDQTADTLIVSGSSNNAALVPDANIVFGGNGPNRTVNVTPLADKHGVALITVTVTDAAGDSASDSFNLTVNSTNQPPVINNQTFSVDENTANGTLVGTVIASDPDIGDTHGFSMTSGNTGNAFSLNATTGGITVNDSTQLNFENLNLFTLTVTVTDQEGASATATVTINVPDVNEAPVALDDAFTVVENGFFDTNGCSTSCDSFTGGATTVLANDSDEDTGDTLTVAGTAFPLSITTLEGGDVTLYENGTLSYSPPTRYTGPDSFTYKSTDGALESNVATVNISVIVDPGAPPTAPDLTFPAPGVPQRLTQDFAHDRWPAWDPNGDLIVFGTLRNPAPSGKHNLGGVQADGTAEGNYATASVGTAFGLVTVPPKWAGVPNTNQVLIEETCAFEYLAFNTGSSPASRDSCAGDEPPEFVSKLLIGGGQGGHWFTASRNGQVALWRHSSSGGGGTVTLRTAPYSSLTGQANGSTGTVILTSVQTANNSQPLRRGVALNVDGSKAVVAQFIEPSGGVDLFVYDASVNGPPICRLTNSGENNGWFNQHPDVASDGTTVVYQTNQPGQPADLATIQITDCLGTPQTLTNSPDVGESVPSWSPDGQYIAFQRRDNQANYGAGMSEPDNDNIWKQGFQALPLIQGGTLNVPAPGLLAQARDIEQDALTVTTTPVTPPSHGNLTLNADGSFVYTHNGSTNVVDSFVYEISDGTNAVNATVTINVSPDSDSDGLSDAEEAFLGTNPNNPDTDGDGLEDGLEHNTLNTDPVKADSDGDGFSDFEEVNQDGNPNDYNPGSGDFDPNDSGSAPANLAPVNSAPARFSVPFGGSRPVTGLSVSDPDAGGEDVTVTLAVDGGHTLSVRDNVTGGLIAENFNTAATGTEVSFTAPIAAINATLAAADGLVFHDANGVMDIANLTVVTDDLGNRGLGGARTDTDIVTLDIHVIELKNVDGLNGLEIVGAAAGDRTGESVDFGGDFNNDGYSDIAIAASWADPQGRNAAGKSYVFYGAEESNVVSSITISGSGRDVRVLGEQTLDHLGQDVANVGDLNGDGIDDFLTGAHYYRANTNKGAAYVVFGSNTPAAAVNLQTPLNGVNGFRVLGLNNDDRVGIEVGMGGDVNGDGLSDMLLAAPNFGTGANDKTGVAYLLFGAAGLGGSGNFDLNTINGTNGYRISGITGAGDLFSVGLTIAKDVNGDGIDDVLIGARGRDTNGADSGVAYLIYGGAFAALDAADGNANGIINIAHLNASTGVEIRGATVGEIAGVRVAGGGDANGDGFNDFLIGAPKASEVEENAGKAYLVYGGNSIGASGVLELSGLAASGNGVVFVGSSPLEQAGRRLALSSDINGDGYDDIAIGSTNARLHDLPNVGEVRVVFGGPSIGLSGIVDLANMSGTEGLRIQGFEQGGQAGKTAMGGDANGDGLQDIVTAAGFFFEPDPASKIGKAYLIYGDDYSGQSGIIFGTNNNDDDPGLLGDAGDNVIVAGRGNDDVDGLGGRDVIYAGAGNDRIVLDLQDWRVDAGSGDDTLILNGVSVFDLPAHNAGGANYNGFRNFEIIQLNSSLKINAIDLLRITDARNTLRVEGSASDSVTSDDSWVYQGIIEVNGSSYAEYVIGNATLLVHVAIEQGDLGGFNAAADTDGDRLTDGEEIAAGTDVNMADTDGDHINDFVEVVTGGDPLVADAVVLHVQPTPTVSCESGDGSNWGDGKAYCNNIEVITHLTSLPGTLSRCHVLYQGDSAQYNYGTLDFSSLGGANACSQIILVGGINDYELSTGKYTHSNSLIDGLGVCSGPSGTPDQRPITVPASVTYFGLFGFSLTGGWMTADFGGGIYFAPSTGSNTLDFYDNQVFSNCTLDLGGGAYIGRNWGGTFNNSDFTDNHTTGRNSAGGGLYKTDTGAPSVIEFVKMIFNVNTSAWGGAGAYFEGTDITVKQSKFTSNILFGNNTTANSGCFGGGLHANLGLVNISETIFAGNYAFCESPSPSSGGGGAIIGQPTAGSMIRDSEFLSNTVTASQFPPDTNYPVGGGLAVIFATSTSDIDVRNNLFVGNNSDGLGGGMGVHDSDQLTVRLNSFGFNQAKNINDQETLGTNAGTGGGVFAKNSSGMTLSDNIAFNNHNGTTAGAAVPGEDCFTLSTATINGSNNTVAQSSACNEIETGRLTNDPLWFDRFYLSQSPDPLSPAVDSGSAPDADSFFCSLVSAAPGCGHGYTTNFSGVEDSGLIDRGFHNRKSAEGRPAFIIDNNGGPYFGDCSLTMSFHLESATNMELGSGHKVAACISSAEANAADYEIASITSFDAVTGDDSSAHADCGGPAILIEDQGYGSYQFSLYSTGGPVSAPLPFKVFVDDITTPFDYAPTVNLTPSLCF